MFITVGDFAEVARDLPLQLHQIFQKLKRGNLRFELEHLNLQRLLGECDRASNCVSFRLSGAFFYAFWDM